MRRSLSIVLLLVASATVSEAAFAQYTHTLHVNPISGDADDANPGTEALPLNSISEAIERAVENKRNYESTRVVLHPATYREELVSFGYTNWRTNDPGNHTPIVVEAKHSRTAVISGSDIWLDWQYDSGNDTYNHNWPYDWGRSPDPWDGVREVDEIVLRREMIFVEGIPLVQVMTLGEVEPGMFYVNESNDTVYMKPPSGVSMDNPKIEVAVRTRLWEQFYEDYVTIRGVVFEHAATPWSTSEAAVWIGGSDNFTFEDSEIRWTNWQGIYIGESDDVLVKNVTLNNHGGQGWGMFRNKRVTVLDSETSHNNWRGKQGGFSGWSVGNKVLSIHGLIIRNHKANDNYSRGLWLDYDISDVVLDRVEVNDNLLDGMWLEATQGPTTIKNSVFCRNGWSGLKTTYSQHVSVDHNVFALNATRDDVELNDSQIVVDGGGERVVQDFETRNQLPLTVRDWAVTNNVFVGTTFLHPYAKGPTLIDNDLNQQDWDTFLQTFSSDYNVWHHAQRPEVFGFPQYNDLSLGDWQTQTGQDFNSTFHTTEPSYECDIERLNETDDMDLFGEASGSAAERTLNVSANGDDTGMLKFRAFDVNDVSEIKAFVNGVEIPLSSRMVSSGAWVEDSVEFSASILAEGANEVRFEVAQRPAVTETIGFKLADVSLSTRNTGVGTVDTPPDTPEFDFALTGNYPNPFSNATTLSYNLPEAAEVEAFVYDLLGRQQMRLPRRPVDAGQDRQLFLDTAKLPVGTYMVRVVAHVPGQFLTATRQLSLVR